MQYVDNPTAEALAEKNNIDLEKVGGVAWWKYALNCELTTVNLLLSRGALRIRDGFTAEGEAAQLAIVRLQQYPDYYRRLKKMEDQALRYWRNM